ncbi:hypothetical protein EV679_1415 [Kerstersia gyiorum]|uniref:Uncharacterized protein n=1 Tax=Kerstersia gyiorum TaxID=206506 RepID=A0A4Q7MNC9_9BURK|nr:hypothetical protein [Kerstersia gyiorum]KAB0543617.1 hypothetical protein F7P85_07045 [Kerstersia gyiorum]QBR40215.1 hypothetical protein EHF36_05935 [Kerstersia gyiorum]RZS70027.1 hypothetical protein EV679_1415 [Kerstersia gyiorum]
MSSHRYLFHVPSRQVNRAAQRGVALLELMVAAAVAVLLAAWGAGYWVDRAESVRSAAVGAWLGEVGKAISQMLEDEFAGLADPLASLKHRYANRLAPTIAELKQSGYLPAAFPEQSAWGVGADIRIWRQGSCPDTAGCMLQAMAYLPLAASRPPVDMTRRADALAQLQGRGGMTWPHRPERMRGALFDVPNPLPDGTRLPAGTVGVYYALDATRLGEFVRMRDTRDPSLQGNLSVAGRTAVMGTLRAAGRVEADEYLKLGGQAGQGGACAEAGLLARDVQGGGLLLCANGRWQHSAAGGFGGMYSLSDRFGCRGTLLNPMTGQCSCPAGFRAIHVSVLKPNNDRGEEVSVYLCQR